MAPSHQQGHLEISPWSKTGDTLKTNVKSVRFVQILPTLTQVFQPFAENNSQSIAFYKGKQWNEVENCLSQGKEQKHGRGTSIRAETPSQAHSSPYSSGVPAEMNRSKFSLTVKCHHLACPASREILAVSAREAEGLRNGRGMQAAVAHMVGTGTQNPGE